ncbi:alpha/beta hydrolase [Kribbella antibiotica]|uniref:Alpha/beta hydrolase n=1 Tax=Kribbella antibiotica TaxID=190195 RepID=A0A4V2YQS5_9ACTN|nr:alpha/beta hydrolase [Kribbella antibiotica]TDD63267.1 alpha/beta hydrolase [Kribbella antibiotica]
MNLTLLLLTKLAKLRLSTIPAPETDPNSIAIDPDPAVQIRPGRSVHSTKGIRYDGKLRMDLLVPSGPGPHPVVLYLPGGGFVAARRQMASKQRAYVADAGFAVASIDYRTTSNGATYRDGLADVAAALRFLHAHAAEYHLDPMRIAVWGESAGGYLASMAATEPDNQFVAAVSMFGASDLSTLTDGFDIEAPDAIAAYVPDFCEGNPAGRVTDQTPPFLLLHGDDDRLIAPAQTAILHQALLAAGIESTRYVVRGAGHGTLSEHPAVWTSAALMDYVVDFFRAHL